MKAIAILFIAIAQLCLFTTSYADEVNVNTADATEIAAQLKGVGLSKAEAIVEYRQTHGEFESPDELALVKGIGLRTVDINRDKIQTQADKKRR